MSLLCNRIRTGGSLLPWDNTIQIPTDKYPLLQFAHQSNTVTQNVLVNRISGDIFRLASGSKQFIHFYKITKTVEDLRFKSQRVISVVHDKLTDKNTILISLPGVVVTTGAKSTEAGWNAAASTVRILTEYMVNKRNIFCYAKLNVVNTPFYGGFLYPIDLALLAFIAQKDCNNIIVYEHDVFPGVRIQICGYKGAITVFDTGTFLAVGLVTASAVFTLLGLLYKYIVAASITDPTYVPQKKTKGKKRFDIPHDFEIADLMVMDGIGDLFSDVDRKTCKKVKKIGKRLKTPIL